MPFGVDSGFHHGGYLGIAVLHPVLIDGRKGFFLPLDFYSIRF